MKYTVNHENCLPGCLLCWSSDKGLSEAALGTKTAKSGKHISQYPAPTFGEQFMTQSDFEIRFAPVFALKDAAGSISPEARPLKSQERRQL